MLSVATVLAIHLLARQYNGEAPPWIAAALATAYLAWHFRQRIWVSVSAGLRAVLSRDEERTAYNPADESYVQGRIVQILSDAGAKEILLRDKTLINARDGADMGVRQAEPPRRLASTMSPVGSRSLVADKPAEKGGGQKHS